MKPSSDGPWAYADFSSGVGSTNTSPVALPKTSEPLLLLRKCGDDLRRSLSSSSSPSSGMRLNETRRELCRAGGESPPVDLRRMGGELSTSPRLGNRSFASICATARRQKFSEGWWASRDLLGEWARLDQPVLDLLLSHLPRLLLRQPPLRRLPAAAHHLPPALHHLRCLS